MDERREERMLRRIIALLVLLADVTESAAERAFPVRFLVLLVLRRAEAVARAYAADALWVDVITYEDDGEIHGGPAGAMALALRFRALAAALRTLLAPEGIPGMEKSCAGSAVRGMARVEPAAGYRRAASGRAMPSALRHILDPTAPAAMRDRCRPYDPVRRGDEKRPDPPRVRAP